MDDASLWPIFAKPEKTSLSPEIDVSSRWIIERLVRHTIKHSLAEGHEGNTIQQDDCFRGSFPIDCSTLRELSDLLLVRSASALDVLGPSVGIKQIKVVDIAYNLHNVHTSLSSSKAITRVICRPAVNVIDLAVELVRYPKRLLVLASRHGMWTKQNIEAIPGNQWHRDT